MATISSIGLGSGLDANAIITQLMAIEKQPLTQMQTAATKLQDTLSSYGKVQSYVSALRDAAASLAGSSQWGQVATTSGDSTVFSAAPSTSTTQATPGSHSVTVDKLASGQTLFSKTYASANDVVGGGSLTITIGGVGTVIPIDANPGTLASIRDQINAAGISVKASIVTDTSGARLIMRSTATGASQSFTVSVADNDGDNTDAAGLSLLGYPPTAIGAPTEVMTQAQPAQDASVTVDGVPVSWSTNTLTDVIQGVSLKLNKVSATPIDLTVAQDTTSIKKSITDFATAYNNLAKYLTDQTSYNAATKTGALLQGDSAVNALRTQMRSIVMDTFGGASATFTRLAQIGLDPQTDGTIKINSTKLDTALTNPTAVQTLFAATDASGQANLQGFGVRLKAWGDTLLGLDGAITTRTNSLQTQIRANTKQQDDFNTRMTAVEKRMRAQYTALDTQMSKLNALSTYVSQQMAVLTGSTSTTSTKA
ncbi:MAG: hypothetical protein RJA44_2096 [Pseudomonadota bacterium]|jgi:flagellar hook-associated protein 2